MSEGRASQPFDLSIQIGKITTLEERIIAEVDPRHDVLGTECHLFGLGEEIVHATVEHQASYFLYWNFFFRNDLGGIKDIEGELVGEFFVEQLKAEFPLRTISGLDGTP